ncbi:NAD(P)H-binding protein [Nocardiopsis sp. HUAS JQ3]|uniref:NAD(P)H-binding protein n=1 Tax=Nocardiopsis sp. HUAS JQ3 TaxID=3061629 RepID=UPI0023A98320|nr:NAD(P)H-binding protein [Nocardiopsis sp. HUAS JQ3]WDZ93470.1 NAD(P)H-binding protein [Nocardiopsis sp. HUAS JQ3]
MSDTKRVVILGGHGKVALLTAPKLTNAGYRVDSLIRDPGQSTDVEAVGGDPVVLDIEQADVEALTRAFDGAQAVVFAAGAGGGSPARTNQVDYEAAVRAMAAAQAAGVRRFVTVSYAGAAVDVDRIDPDNSFYAYAKAKHDADAHLRETGLDYTILGPGMLTLEPATGRIRLADADGTIDGRPPGEEGHTSRDNVAEVITHVITADAAIRQTVNFYDGQTPISQALR